MFTIIFPVLNERLRLESGVTRTVEYLRKIAFEDYEIIIVDTGSTDATKWIAAGYTDKIYDFEWINDFSAARNFAFSKAGCDYIFSADADEVLDDTNNYALRELKHMLLPEIDIVQMLSLIHI